jgi:hypothetical protein
MMPSTLAWVFIKQRSSAAVLDSAGNLVMEAILETKTETILQFLRGLRGSLRVSFEEGTWAAWLHDLLKSHVTRVVVCDTRKTGLGKHRNRNDRDDARGLARLLYRNELEPVYHGEHGLRTLLFVFVAAQAPRRKAVAALFTSRAGPQSQD